MAEKNTDSIEGNLNRREIKRNSSNQIVSYTLKENSTDEYGYQLVPAIQTHYDKETYAKTIERLSNELVATRPDIPTEIVEQKFISEKKIYVNSVANDVDDPFDDLFSGRYEITDNAETYFRGRDYHSINPSYYDAAEFARRDFEFKGFRKIYWDNTLKGPELDENGYRITKELIDSGKNIRLKTTIGVGNEISPDKDVALRLVFIRKRPPFEPREEFAEAYTNVAPNEYLYLATTYDVMNEDMEEGDLWQVHAQCGNASSNFFQYGEKSIFTVEVFDSENPVETGDYGAFDKGTIPLNQRTPNSTLPENPKEVGDDGDDEEFIEEEELSRKEQRQARRAERKANRQARRAERKANRQEKREDRRERRADRKEDRQERREERKEERSERREARQENRQNRREERREGRADRKEDRKERRQNRRNRRRNRRR